MHTLTDPGPGRHKVTYVSMISGGCGPTYYGIYRGKLLVPPSGNIRKAYINMNASYNTKLATVTIQPNDADYDSRHPDFAKMAEPYATAEYPFWIWPGY